MAAADHIVSQLQMTVAINEEIKHIVAMALRINLLATNAIVAARRAGDTARGFGQVSEALRQCSQEFKTRMDTLRTVTYTSVDTVSLLLKDARMAHILQRAATDDVSRNQLQPAMARLDQALAASATALEQSQKALLLEIDEVKRLSEMGSALSRTAKIEAAYGGAHRPALTQVADEFASRIEQIMVSLARLKEHTGGIHA